jgi:hypothetical protein
MGNLTSGVGGSRAGYRLRPCVHFHIDGNTSDARLYRWVDLLLTFVVFLQFIFYFAWSTYQGGMTDNKCGINQSINA